MQATIHERVVIGRWTDTFALARLRREAHDFVLDRNRRMPGEYSTQDRVDNHIRLMEPAGEMVAGPRDIAVVEQLRDEALARHGRLSGEVVPTDVFVFGLGDAPMPEATKVGGLPYWPADRPWPSAPSGGPMTYIAQFCFADSRDIVPDLPGEVLVLFGDWEAYCDDEGTALLGEWVSIGPRPLIAPGDLVATDWPHITPCYGQIHRTWDYAGDERPFDDYRCPWLLESIEGTKIGGLPRLAQGDPILPGQFLCSLGSIGAAPGRAWPFVNVETPYAFGEPEGLLSWGDAGSLYLFLEPGLRNGPPLLHWTVQGY